MAELNGTVTRWAQLARKARELVERYEGKDYRLAEHWRRLYIRWCVKAGGIVR